MGNSRYLESRVEKSKQVYEFLVAWEPPTVGGLSANVVKSAILSGAGRFVLEEMRGGSLLDQETEDQLVSSLRFCEGVFENAEFVDAGHGVRERVFANIYDLLIASQIVLDDTTGRSYVYRGQYDSRWGLVSSFNRATPRPAPHLVRTIHNARISYLQKKFPNVDFEGLTELQQEAVIQHYLSGTHLIDFTRSLAVAAFFATRGPRTGSVSPPKCGAIYRISPKDIEHLMIGKVEAPELPPHFLRIHRQQGVFIVADFEQLINEPGLFDRWVFYHTIAGMNFQCPSIRITEEFLLPEDISKTT